MPEAPAEGPYVVNVCLVSFNKLIYLSRAISAAKSKMHIFRFRFLVLQLQEYKKKFGIRLGTRHFPFVRYCLYAYLKDLERQQICQPNKI